MEDAVREVLEVPVDFLADDEEAAIKAPAVGSYTLKESTPLRAAAVPLPAGLGGPALIFLVLIMTGSMVNFDSGGTAAVLVLLSKGCPTAPTALGHNATLYVQDPHYPCLSEADKGILGAVPYIGLCFGCPLAGQLFARMSEKKVLLGFLMGNVAATFVFAVVLNKYYLWSAKFVVGLTQSAISIYAPVWVSKFAPPAYKTLWYGLMQSSTAMGNLIGYAVCGYLVDLGVYYQRAFQIQAVWLLLTCCALLPIDSKRINVSAQSDPPALDGGSNESSPSKLVGPDKGIQSLEQASLSILSLWDAPEEGHAVDGVKGANMLVQLTALSRHAIFVSTVLTLCSLYFVVTAVQYWATQFFTIEFRIANGAEITTYFLFISGTAPILGVIVGSSIVDRAGGYDTPQQMAHALFLTNVWSVAASVAGVLAVAVDVMKKDDPASMSLSFNRLLFLVWVMLFFGGAIVPAGTGIGMAAVPESLRATASSWSMLLYNVFGFSLGAYLPGHIAEVSNIRHAMHIVFLWALSASVALAWGYALARRRASRTANGWEEKQQDSASCAGQPDGPRRRGRGLPTSSDPLLVRAGSGEENRSTQSAMELHQVSQLRSRSF
eukprot:gnl/TRDRNA2_/TRDRNA2_162429_c1_seq1.p1 gnl/TRDRNA2_/TRDRNA2_162429_c1~~gnl/TRDRNA2_/TRDRNA2_162429_c1_seq1.p1  ORF type:complete len:638 (-),score=97.73 gnl/TRDRNA2_/TRDRNA2_162429_c1_seq1:201-2018(-)